MVLVKAEVNVNGTWQKIMITAKESEYPYKVHYKGFSDSADERVYPVRAKYKVCFQHNNNIISKLMDENLVLSH